MPSVLFVCSRNGGKSQMAAALMRQRAGGRVEVFSAGAAPGQRLSDETRASLARSGVSLGEERPKAVDPDLLSRVDRVVVIGHEDEIKPVVGMQGSIQAWHLDEPSMHGIQGPIRMDLIRDELDDRVLELIDELGIDSIPEPEVIPSSQCQ